MFKNKIKMFSMFAVMALLAATFGISAPAFASQPQTSAVSQVGVDRGVLVVKVDKSSPAAKSGLRRGDIILSVNGKITDTMLQFNDAMAAVKPGAKIRVVFLRGNSRLNYSLTTGDSEGKPTFGVTLYNDLPTEGVPPNEAPPVVVPAPAVTPGPVPPPSSEMTPSVPISGAMIMQVVTDTAASKAGLLARDVILSVDGQTVDPQHSLADLIGGRKPGDKVKLAVLRENAIKQITVTLGENPDDKTKPRLGVTYVLMADAMTSAPSPRNPRQAPTAAPAPQGTPMPAPTQAPSSSAPADAVQIRVITAGSPAEKAGLQVGDIILSIDGKTLATPGDVVDYVTSHKIGDTLMVLVQRDGAAQPVKVPVTLAANATGAPFMGVQIAAVQPRTP